MYPLNDPSGVKSTSAFSATAWSMALEIVSTFAAISRVTGICAVATLSVLACPFRSPACDLSTSFIMAANSVNTMKPISIFRIGRIMVVFLLTIKSGDAEYPLQAIIH